MRSSQRGSGATGALLALAAGWAALLHHGLGPRPKGTLDWWAPRGFLAAALAGSPLEAWTSGLGAGALLLWAPALALAIAAFARARSALVRLAAATVALAAALFVFYALASPITRVAWRLFHWRASASMLVLALVVAAAVVAPWLAASWLRLGWAARLAWFLPIAFAVVALERNVTGTDPSLPFAVSPWPVVTVFGLESAAAVAAALGAGIALGLLALARLRGARAASRAAASALLAAAGVALPAGALALGAAGGVLPFRAGARELAAAAVAAAAGLALAAGPGRREPARLRRRARACATGALLVALPVVVGQAWARSDYRETRGVRAQRIIDSLAAYYAREQLYPDDLDALVESGDLDAVPAPRIGFRLLADESGFTYQGFGTSYLLEFSAPRWVQCAYNPPYADEELEGDGAAGEAADGDENGGLPGAWSCPSTPPELW